MHDLLKEITQISIYLKEEAERVNEVAFFQPLLRKSQINEESKPIAARRWCYTSNIPFFPRLALKVQSFLFKRFPLFIPAERLTPEAKFKTILAMLLAQEEVREFFLSDLKRQENFYQALAEGAAAIGYHDFSTPSLPTHENIPIKISRHLTQLGGKKQSLLDDLTELNLQIAALNYQERSEILFRILNRIERPPITSVIEVTGQESTKSIPLTTKYAKYQISHYDPFTGNICYTFTENHATSSIRTLKNSLPGAKGAANQRIAFDAETEAWIGSYCGELSTPFHVLEQIFLILGETNGSACIVDQTPLPKETPIKEKKILFTSLFSWDEIGLITDQQFAIQKWDQKIILCGQEYYRLNLLYFNISFNAFNKYPVPAEIKATIQDIDDEASIVLIAEAWEHLGLHSEELKGMANRILTLRGLSEHAFLERKRALMEEIDRFRQLKNTLIDQINPLPSTPFNQVVKTLLSGKKPDGKSLKGIDKLLHLDYTARYLGYFHNKNCHNATDRSAGANAADKAQYTFQKIYKAPFLPGYEQAEERALFKVLYSMYLVWEEPEINTWLSTGFMGEKFYNNFIQKNPETTRYLVRWLKKHPEIYLGLSNYRT
jgi:hypothetical protein